MFRNLFRIVRNPPRLSVITAVDLPSKRCFRRQNQFPLVIDSPPADIVLHHGEIVTLDVAERDVKFSTGEFRIDVDGHIDLGTSQLVLRFATDPSCRSLGDKEPHDTVRGFFWRSI